MGASVEGLDDEGMVDVMRHDQVNRRRSVLVEQLPVVGVDARRLRLELGNLGSGTASAGLVHVARRAHRDEARRFLRQLAVRTQMGASHPPTANDGDAQRIVARQCAISLVHQRGAAILAATNSRLQGVWASGHCTLLLRPPCGIVVTAQLTREG